MLKAKTSWLLLGLVLLLVGFVRVRVRDAPLERDEGEYAYAGQLILHGVPPYKEAYNMKLPGTCAAYALSMAVLGRTPSGIHLGVMLVNLGSIVLVYLIGRRLLDEITGVVAAVVFALMSLSPYVLGLAGHATHFVTLSALGGIWVLSRALEEQPEVRGQRSEVRGQRSEVRGQRSEGGQPSTFNLQPSTMLFASGLLFGLAFLMKQQGVFFGLFGAIYLIFVRVSSQRSEVRGQRSEVRGQRSEITALAKDLALFASGYLLPYVATCAILAACGVFHDFWFWTVTYAHRYVTVATGEDAARAFRTGLQAVLGPNLGFWLLPLLGAVMMWWDDRMRSAEGNRGIRGIRGKGNSHQAGSKPRVAAASVSSSPSAYSAYSAVPSSLPYPRFFLTALLLCSIGSVSVGFYFRSHYFITLLPALALLTGVAVSRSVYLLKHDRSIELFLALPVALGFVISLGAVLIGNGSFWFAMSPIEVVRNSHGSTIFGQAVKVAQYLKEVQRGEVISNQLSVIRGQGSEVSTSGSPQSTTTPAEKLGPNGGGNQKSKIKNQKSLAVLGSEPEIFFYSGLRSVTGYIYMYPLFEEQPFAERMQDQVIADFELAKPEYVVFVNDNYSWLPQEHSLLKIREWWKAEWAAHYDLVEKFDIQEGGDLPQIPIPGVKRDEADNAPKEAKAIYVLNRRP